MDIKDYADMWDKQADEWNQWDSLDCDERCCWIIAKTEKLNIQPKDVGWGDSDLAK